MRKSIPSFVESELGFLKLGLGFSGGVADFLESQHTQIALLEVNCEFYPVDVKWTHDKSMLKF